MKQVFYLSILLCFTLLFSTHCKKEDDIAQCPDCPVITALSPASGAPGTLITITGRNFQGLQSVVFDNNVVVPINPDSTSAQKTSVVAPDLGKNGPVKVQVIRRFTSGAGGTDELKSVEDVSFTYTQGPIFTSFSPVSGKKGAEITLTGRYFGSNPRVFFANAEVSTFTLKSDTLLRVILPAKAGNGPIRVTTAAGVSVSSNASFTYTYQFNLSLFLGAPGQKDFIVNVPAADARAENITQIASDTSGNVYIVDQYNPSVFDVYKIDRNPPHTVSLAISGGQGACIQLIISPQNAIYVTTDQSSVTHLYRYTATQNSSIYSSTDLQQAGLDAAGEVYLFMGGSGGGIYNYTGSSLLTLSSTPVYTYKVQNVGNNFLYWDIDFKRMDLSNNQVSTLYNLPLYSIHSWAYSPLVDRLYFGTSNTIRVKNGTALDPNAGSEIIPELENIFAAYMGADTKGNLYFRRFGTIEESCLYKATLE